MSDENPEIVTKKKKPGASGWKKYNAKRAETGIRSDPYVKKRPSRKAPSESHPAVADTLVQVSTDQQKPGATAIVEKTSAEKGVLVAAAGSAGQQPAAAEPSSAAIVPAEAEHAKRSDSAVAEMITPSQGSQGSAVAARPTVCRSIGVGEHLSGEAFLWRGIWDMP